MHVLVAYDIVNNKTRARVFSFLKEKGLHSQKSIFECEMDAALLESAVRYLESIINKKSDSILFYPLCRRCTRKAEVIGQGLSLIKTDWLVI